MVNALLRRMVFLILFAGGPLALSPALTLADVPGPEIVDACNFPQPLNPLMPLAGTRVNSRQGIVWNGQEFVLAYANGTSQLVFQKVFADGTPDGPPIVNPGGSGSNSSSLFPVSLVFDGTGYAAAYIGNDGSSIHWQIHFVKLDLNFNPLVAAKRVSFVGGVHTVHSYWPRMAAGGGLYCIAWYDNRTGVDQVYATILNGDGTVANAGTAHDLTPNGTVFGQFSPAVAWSPAGGNGTGGFQIVWEDYRNAKWEIWGIQWTVCCGFNFLNQTVFPAASNASDPDLAYGPNWGMLTWTDTRDGNEEIYYALLMGLGYKFGGDFRLTNNVSSQSNPWVVWNGTQYGLFWNDSRYPGGDVAFQAVSANGAAFGSSIQVTFGLGWPFVSAAPATAGYLLSGYVEYNRNYVVPVGCNYPSNPPCPSNPVAYGISGTAATISWQPSLDPYTDLAYYAVYRNNALIGKTASTLFADTGLSLSTTYNYVVTAINAADLASSGCGTGNSLFVKTNATLLLMVDKSSPDAHLVWTDASGETLPFYSVFRGTDPRVMQQVASISTGSYADPNVLMDGVAYFYTVDDPGW